ncbi:MAG TPA: lysylphosphatidylglycerol synthase domain-containing protein, partial [Nitrospirota bacterium]
VFLDRYMGLLGLLFIGFVSGLLAFRSLASIGMQWVIPSMTAVFMLVSLAVFGLRIGRRFAVIRDFYEYLHRYHRRKKTILKAFVLSLVIQTATIGMIYVVALGIDLRLTFTALFVFVPIIITVTTLPISIAGLGVRESAFAVLFGLVGVAPRESVAISFLWFLCIVAASLVGLVEYIRFRNAGSGGAGD